MGEEEEDGLGRTTRKKGPCCGKPMDPLDLSGPESDREGEDDPEILFPARTREPEGLVTPPRRAQEIIDCDSVNMVKTLNEAIAAVSQDTARIQRAYQQLCAENKNLTAMVREYGSSPETMRPYGRSQETTRPHPTIQADVMDGEGNLRAADIGITWEGNETFLHGVKVVGPQFSRPAGPGPIMSTPYSPRDDEDRRNWSTTAQPPTPSTPDTDGHVHRPSPEVRQGYRPAAPIQRFNNRPLNWPAWFRYFRAVADVHWWNKDQRALQLALQLVDRKLQTLIEVCTDFSSLMAPSHLHRAAEQTFAVHQEVESYPEDEGELEDIFAVGDRPPRNNRRPPELSTTPTLQQMFALARRMGYKMRPIARQTDGNRPNSGNHSFSDQGRGFHPQMCTGRDYSRIKCFSCGQFGRM